MKNDIIEVMEACIDGKLDEVDLAQMSLFDTVTDDNILDEIKEIDLGNLTPIDALNTLYKLQGKLKNRYKG